MIEVACFAHARRKFHDCISSDPELAHVALAWISKLYDVERAAKHQFAQQPDDPKLSKSRVAGSEHEGHGWVL